MIAWNLPTFEFESGGMSINVKVVNLETGLPDRVQALERLKVALTQARKKGTSVLKIVHGYGSTGVGGILRPVVRNFLRQAKENGEIRLFVNGESFSSFDQRSKDLIAQAPQFLLDPDLGRGTKASPWFCYELPRLPRSLESAASASAKSAA